PQHILWSDHTTRLPPVNNCEAA
ncbi:MAG: hypothetical protein QOG10_1908, partial [Kribbellaceae bacterium]|nr:hypothetical protein [Kribbellaceae bacterium]